MANQESEEIVQNQTVKKKGSLWKIVIIVTVAVILLAGGGFGTVYYFLHSPSGQKAEGAAPVKPPIGALWPMEPFIVNLADNQGERYLKLVMQLELSDPSVPAELDLLKPKLRDNILDLLTAKSYSELMNLGGKQRLREEIVNRLNSFLTKGRIERAYFTEFVIQ